MSYLALFCFLVVSRARVHFCCAPLIVWLALIVCDMGSLHLQLCSEVAVRLTTLMLFRSMYVA